MKYFAKVLSLCYFLGAVLHLADIFDLRLKFSEMNPIWKSWIIYLTIFDLVAGIGLWNNRSWGFLFFLIVTASQLLAYTVFSGFFGEQLPLIIFHCVALCTYLLLLIIRKTSHVYGAIKNAK